ncbi:unnamed protein product, partial [marine sediment metagenome]
MGHGREKGLCIGMIIHFIALTYFNNSTQIHNYHPVRDVPY